MAHSHRPKQPLDVLQSMINGILIEVGRALRATNKEGGRTLAISNTTRLRSFFPGAIDNFHQALDDLEGDIVRAKAVFVRDLEELRARRYALENPPPTPVVDTATDDSMPVENLPENLMLESNGSTPQAIIKEEQTVPQETAPEIAEAEDVKPVIDPPKDTVPEVSDSSKGLQGPSPPSSTNDTNAKSNPIGLDVDATPSTEEPALATSGIPDSPLGSLFGITDSGNNGLDMNFDSVDFLDAGNTQDQNDFDLSTFGNTEDFNLDLHTSNDAGTTNTSNKQDNLFGMGDSGGAGDLMDLDLDLNAGGDGSAFDDLFDFGADADDGGGMEHGNADSTFFGIE